MAKAVIKQGLLKTHTVTEIETDQVRNEILAKMYSFVELMRREKPKICSFCLIIKNDHYKDFSYFEKVFWDFLSCLSHKDHEQYPHDPRVASDPKADNFSYSLMSEAFFILALHPKSSRWVRRFPYPTIVFNPHVQFENLRLKGVFKKVRDTIRMRDFKLQGSINPMLTDFGERSEIFQYLGKNYAEDETIPLSI